MCGFQRGQAQDGRGSKRLIAADGHRDHWWSAFNCRFVCSADNNTFDSTGYGSTDPRGREPSLVMMNAEQIDNREAEVGALICHPHVAPSKFNLVNQIGRRCSQQENRADAREIAEDAVVSNSLISLFD